MLSVIGILVAMVFIILAAFWQWSALYSAIVAASIVIFTSGLNWVDAITGSYMQGVSAFIAGYFGMIMLGAILAKLYAVSGAATSISQTIFRVLIKPGASPQKRQSLAIAILFICAGLMTFGGIHVTILVFTLYPFALEIAKQADISKSNAIGLLCGACFTFAMTAPGTPQLPNVVPMDILGTSSTAALIPGIVGVIVEIVAMYVMLTVAFNRSRKKGEHFAYGPKDIVLDDSKDCPNFIVSLLPILIVIVLFNGFRQNVVVAIAIADLSAIVLFSKYIGLREIIPTISSGASSCLSGIMFMASMTGMATVVKSTEGFTIILNAVLNLGISGYIKVILCVAILALITGAAGTAIMLILPDLAPTLLASGLPAGALHRISAFTSSTLDSLPSSGAFLMTCEFADVKIKDAYPPVFLCCVVATFLGTIAVTIVCALAPGLC